MRRRVVVVDDDDVSRRGMAELLADRPEIELVAALTHAAALDWSDAWDGVDVVVVDAADERHAEDHFQGVKVVETIRRHRRSDQTLVLVVTGHFFDDAVRRRMYEAKADLFYHRSRLQDATSLQEAVLRPDLTDHGVPAAHDLDGMMRQGVADKTRVNAAVNYAQQEHLAETLDTRSGSRSRRWLRLRREFNRRAHLQPVNSDGTEPHRPQSQPSSPQISRFLTWATKTKDTTAR